MSIALKPRSDGSHPSVFFDISGLLNHMRSSFTYSGIQRVVTNIVAEFSKVHTTESIYLSYIDERNGSIYCVNLRTIGAATLLSPMSMRDALYADGDLATIGALLYKYGANSHKLRFHRTRLDIAARLGRKKPFRKKNITPEQWLAVRRNRHNKRAVFFDAAQKLSDCARRGDKMVHLDASWSEEFIEPFTAARDAGIEMFTLIHDLIPLRAPETLDSSGTTRFCRYLLGTLKYTDHYLANSAYTRTDLLEFFDHVGVKSPVRTIPLAQTGLSAALPELAPADLDGIDAVFTCYPEAMQLMYVSQAVRAATAVPFVLCVGTIESRKNLWRLAMAWRRMINVGVPDIPRLVIAGRPGSHSETFFNLMDSTGFLDGYVSVLNGPSDAELDYMYRRCLFFTMPSLFEGWGLPVGEGLAYGKTGLVSEATSLPEVGGDLVMYCNPMSIESIASGAEEMIRSPQKRIAMEERVRAAKLRNWADVAQDLCVHLNIDRSS